MRFGSLYLVPASWSESKPGGSWQVGHMCWIWYHSQEAPKCLGWRCLWRSGTTRGFSSSVEDSRVLLCEKVRMWLCDNLSTWDWFVIAYLVHCQIYASVGDNAQNIGDVALVKCLHPLLLQDFLDTIKHSWVLSSLPQGQTGFHYLQGQRPSVRPFFTA